MTKPNQTQAYSKYIITRKHSCQIQLVTEHRKDPLKEIIETLTENQQLFYVQLQRNDSKEICNNIDFRFGCTDQLEGWADYYDELASAKSLPRLVKLTLKSSKSINTSE